MANIWQFSDFACNLDYSRFHAQVYAILLYHLLPVKLNQRLMLQTVRAEFEYKFQPTGNRLPVFSGVMSMNTTVLETQYQRNMCVFFISWTSSLLSHPKFSIPVSDPTCEGNCTSFFLPGGIETAWQVSSSLNSSLTLLQGGLFKGGDTIEIPNAPGVLLNFAPPDPAFEFDLQGECVVYGDPANDAIQLCIRQIGSSIAVGEF